MGFGGIIAGALGGALGGAGQAVAEDARNTMKQEGEMSLLQAKERLQQQRETALANINNDAAMARTNVDQEGATKRTQMTNDTSVKTTQMNNDTSRADAQLQAQTSLQVAKMHEAGADRRTQAEIAGALDRMSVGQRFTTSDGTVLEKGADKTWKTITDPTTGQPAKGVNPEQRDALRARGVGGEGRPRPPEAAQQRDQPHEEEGLAGQSGRRDEDARRPPAPALRRFHGPGLDLRHYHSCESSSPVPVRRHGGAIIGGVDVRSGWRAQGWVFRHRDRQLLGAATPVRREGRARCGV
ncbi:MAG: hypothetical protein ACXWG8_00320 [Usitatibacter sp.]